MDWSIGQTYSPTNFVRTGSAPGTTYSNADWGISGSNPGTLKSIKTVNGQQYGDFQFGSGSGWAPLSQLQFGSTPQGVQSTMTTSASNLNPLLSQGLSERDQLVQQTAQQRAALMGGLNQQEEGLYTNYENAIKGQESLTNAYNRLATEQGIPGLQKEMTTAQGQVAGLKSQLDTLSENIQSRNVGLPVSEAQRQRQLAYEQTPLQTNLSRMLTGQEQIGNQLATASGNVNNQISMLSQQQQKELQPIQARISGFADRAAREMTGFTQQTQLQLDGILGKIQAGTSLTTQEWQQASAMALQERGFEQQKALNEQQFGYNMALQKESGSGAGATEDLSGLADLLFGGGGNGQLTTPGTTSTADWDKQLQTILGQSGSTTTQAPVTTAKPNIFQNVGTGLTNIANNIDWSKLTSLFPNMGLSGLQAMDVLRKKLGISSGGAG